MIQYPLSVGNVTFDKSPFEGPNGATGMSDLGSKQKSVVREFPGGYVSAQLFGSFPKTIKWNGTLYGNTAISRAFELQRLVDTPEQVDFNWAQWNFQGFVEDFVVNAKGPNQIAYEMVFKPLYNNSTVTGGNTLANNDPFAGIVANGQQTATQQATAPASGTQLPAAVQSGTKSLNQAITGAVQQSGGSVSTIPASTLTTLKGQISDLLFILNPMINGVDPGTSSAAADLAGTLNILNVAFSNSIEQLITTLKVANPNLYQIAAEYYGNASLYWLISEKNNQIDPLPFTDGPIELKIPILPALANPAYSTVLDGKIS